ncbi:MAG: pyridoxamine 5'-phosphate oxidase family protein [Eubacteriales bacterium]
MKGFNQINEILMDQTAVKVLSTTNEDGTVHSIYAGSVSPLDNDNMFVAELIMRQTTANWSKNPNFSLLVTKGMEGTYLIKGKAVSRITEGELIEMVRPKMKEVGFDTQAVWVLNVEEIYGNQANPETCGKKLF